jgi:arginine deiminase
MSRYKVVKLTHEEHLQLAEKFRNTYKELRQIQDVIAERIGHSSRALRRMARVITIMDLSIRNELTEEYYHVTSNEQYAKSGNAYHKDPADRNAPVQLDLFKEVV